MLCISYISNYINIYKYCVNYTNTIINIVTKYNYSKYNDRA